MFLARVVGTVVAVTRHSTIEGCALKLVQRLEADGTSQQEPFVVGDWFGAARGELVIVSTDGDIARARFGDTTPVRMVVAGLVDEASRGGRA